MTSVLAVKPGHDGSIALVDDGRLVFLLEGETDSSERHGPVTASLFMDALEQTNAFPDVIAVGGWHKILPGVDNGIEAGYLGLEPGVLVPTTALGRRILRYSSSHERSHLFSGVAMSPFDLDSEIAVLVWEGVIGSLYRWRDNGRSITGTEVLSQPGDRYAALFALADDSFPSEGGFIPPSMAGKLMALTGFADEQPPNSDSVQIVRSLLTVPNLHPFDKARYRRSALYNCGVTDPELCRTARLLSDEIFATFRRAVLETLPRGLPLVISGGCGLNCDWNGAWEASGLFAAVSVAPCANDSGSAIGTAVDALVQTGGPCSLEWDPYRGAAFVDDVAPGGWSENPFEAARVAALLDSGHVVAWVQGNCEIGPRALGHRSLLATARTVASRQRLNEIKRREWYRPIAPVCLEDELGRWFDDASADRHMLRFRTVLRPEELPAIAHVDGSARVQSVTATSCPELHALLVAHRQQTGAGVLCNTSLNFPGRGFINRTSELLAFCDGAGIDHMVISDRLLVRRATTSEDPAL